MAALQRPEAAGVLLAGTAVVLLAGAELLGAPDAVGLTLTDGPVLTGALAEGLALTVLLESGEEATASTVVEPAAGPGEPLQPARTMAEAATVTKSDSTRGGPKLFMTTACWEVLRESTHRAGDIYSDTWIVIPRES